MSDRNLVDPAVFTRPQFTTARPSMSRRQALGGLAATLLWGCTSPHPRSTMPPTPATLPRASTGRLERLPLLASRHVDPRPVDVWLPPGYDGSRRHAVLVMHDGQMLFDASTTWNRQAWEVDAVAAPLLAAGRLRDFIVVAVHNNGSQRFAEYYPQGFLAHLPAAARGALAERGLQGAPRADAYLRFLVEELKPAIDARYATAAGPQHTMLMGSSMGGLISVYALLEYPQVFGAAAALSTHWITTFEHNEVYPAAALAYLREKLPAPGALKLYMDHGTTQLDAQYGRAQQRIDALLAERGFGPPRVVSRVFEGTGHNERDWSARLHVPLGFLLGR
jgi:enterochelin esterase-like enzyme